MATLTIVSEDFEHRRGSWTFAGVYRTTGAIFRVEIRADAYEHQSFAKVSTWGVGGWNLHTTLPVNEWYAEAPSYTRKELSESMQSWFRWLGHELLERACEALFGRGGDTLRLDESERVSEYAEVYR